MTAGGHEKTIRSCPDAVPVDKLCERVREFYS